MKLDYQEVKTFKVCGIRFELASSWNGLEEWRDKEGNAMIVARDRECGLGAVFKILGMPDGDKDQKITVISCSPTLFDQLYTIKTVVAGKQ